MEKLLKKKKKKAEADGNKTLLTSVCIDLAENYLSNTEYHAAISEYKTVASIYKQQNKMLEYACAHRMIGEAYTHLLLYDNALKHEEIYLKVAQKENNKMEEQRAYATMGHIYLTMSLCSEDVNQKTLEMAANNLLKSLNVCEKLSGVIAKREQMDMMARLFANLGVVKEAQGKFTKGIELVMKSVNICKKYDIFEQLERCYTTLSSLYMKSEDFSSAISNLNLAMETAGRLPQKVALTCASLLSKADILMKMNDLQSAKHVLHKAFKLETPNHNDYATIEKNLKIVMAMSNAEENLLIASLTDHKTRKSLYERLGDGSCYFKNYTSAIDYYQKMLESALKNNESGKTLSPCYVSLAQTYTDNKQYDKAIEYYYLDLELSKDNITESINTTFNITSAMDQAKRDVNEVCAVFNKAQEECKKVDSKKQLARVLERHILYLKKHNRLTDAAKLEPEFEALNCSPSDSESEVGDCEDAIAIGEDVDINNITDLSSSDDEKDLTVKASRKRNKSVKTIAIKRNAKGETQLHVATIDGNVQLVERLLGQGHAVNVRDNAGWLPIHEACICGHLEIVKMLVDKGAAINDRGGVKCEGITPLHDAASNGHLAIIEYMLSKGASPLVKTDNGETPLHYLKTWKASVTLDLEEELLYNRIAETISDALAKAGQHDTTSSLNRSNEALVYVEDDNPIFNMSRTRSKRLNQSQTSGNSSRSESTPSKITKINSNCDLRRNVNAGGDEILSQQSDAASDYRNTIDSFRKTVLNEQKKRKSTQQSAHLTTDEIDVDDWLDDDLNVTNKKKRKVNLSLRRGNSSTSFTCELDAISDDGMIDLENEEPSNQMDSINLGSSTKSVFRKKKSQQTLFKSGFTRVRDSPSPVESLFNSGTNWADKITTCRTQTKISDFVSNFEESTKTRDVVMKECDMNVTQNLIKNQMLYIDVRIDEKLFRIPFPAKDLETLTISWLAEETTNRFYKKEAMKPVIEIETKNGAILCDDDVLSMLFPVGVTQCEELRAKVVKWNVPPLKERYLDACQYYNTEPFEEISNILDAANVNIDLSNRKFREKTIPIARALNRQTSLYELNLSGLLAGNQMIEALCESLPTLTNLTVLNLSTNHISNHGLSTLSSCFKYSPMQSLTALNLSYNPLGKECLKHLADISCNLKLEKLNLCAVDMTFGIFNNTYNQNVKLLLGNLKEFDVSYNDLGKADLLKFLSFLTLDKLEVLDIGNNCVECSGLGEEFYNMIQRNNVEKISLKRACFSWCMFDNNDVLCLLRMLLNSVPVCQLEHLDLSFNDFTAAALQKLLQDASPKSLRIIGCHKLSGSQEEYSNEWSFRPLLHCDYLETTLDYVQDFQQCDTLINMFRNVYDERLDIQGLDEGMLKLSVHNC